MSDHLTELREAEPIFNELRAQATRVLAHGWKLEQSPTVPCVAVLTLRDGTQIRGRASTLLEVLRGQPEVFRA